MSSRTKFNVALIIIGTALIFIGSAMDSRAASPKTHRHTLTVAAHSSTQWSSKQRYRRDELVTVWFYVQGRELQATLLRKNGCLIEYAGHGVIARLHSCDNGAGRSPLRLVIASVRDSQARVTLKFKRGQW